MLLFFIILIVLYSTNQPDYLNSTVIKNLCLFCSVLLYFTYIAKITLTQGYRRFCRKHLSKDLSRFSSLSGSDYDKFSVTFLLADSIINYVVSFSKIFVAKYIKENLQIIFKTVLIAWSPLSDRLYKKPLKARLLDVYCVKFHIERYNLCCSVRIILLMLRPKALTAFFLQLFSYIIVIISTGNNINGDIKLRV